MVMELTWDVGDPDSQQGLQPKSPANYVSAPITRALAILDPSLSQNSILALRWFPEKSLVQADMFQQKVSDSTS